MCHLLAFWPYWRHEARDIELEATLVAKVCRGRSRVGRAQSPAVGRRPSRFALALDDADVLLQGHEGDARLGEGDDLTQRPAEPGEFADDQAVAGLQGFRVLPLLVPQLRLR